jgi:CBS domain-containing protein
MKHDIISIPAETSIREAAEIAVRHRIGLLPVVDEQGKLIGALDLDDLLSLEMPDFFNLVSRLDFVHDFGAVETTRPLPEQLDRPVTALMKPAFSVVENCGLLRAYALMLKHGLLDLAVTSKDGHLVGLASRVDIATAILSAWGSIERSKP